MRNLFPTCRGLTVQLLAITVLPLTLLLLLIAFGSVSLHQQDMRALVGERDERAVQSAAAALASELHHRAASITSLTALAERSDDLASIPVSRDLASDFDGGLAYFRKDGQIFASKQSATLWNAAIVNKATVASSSDPGPVFSAPLLDPASRRLVVIISQFSASRNILVAGAFSPESLARATLSSSFPAHDHVTIYLLDSSRQLLFTNQSDLPQSLPTDHPGVAEALRGESGTLYVKSGKAEHVVAYSPIPPTGWALITEEDWEMVVSPSLQ